MATIDPKIKAGRNLVEAYRTAHMKLYKRGKRKGIPQAHTPILHILQNGLTGLGYVDLNDFFTQSEGLSEETEDGWK